MGPPIVLGAEDDGRGRHRVTVSVRPGRRITIVMPGPADDSESIALITSEIIPALERGQPTALEGT